MTDRNRRPGGGTAGGTPPAAATPTAVATTQPQPPAAPTRISQIIGDSARGLVQRVTATYFALSPNEMRLQMMQEFVRQMADANTGEGAALALVNGVVADGMATEFATFIEGRRANLREDFVESIAQAVIDIAEMFGVHFPGDDDPEVAADNARDEARRAAR